MDSMVGNENFFQKMGDKAKGRWGEGGASHIILMFFWRFLMMQHQKKS